MGLRHWLALAQGAYFLATGIWPLVHMPSFLWITGPKTDLWLVQTVAVLVGVIGLVLLLAGMRRAITFEIGLLGALSALGLAAVDFYFSLSGRIWAVYMLDGVAEIAIVLAWVIALKSGTPGRTLER